MAEDEWSLFKNSWFTFHTSLPLPCSWTIADDLQACWEKKSLRQILNIINILKNKRGNAMKIYDLSIPSGSSHLSNSLTLVSITQLLWKELILAGSFASVGNTGLWPNASPLVQAIWALEQIPIITLWEQKKKKICIRLAYWNGISVKVNGCRQWLW